uniref:Protein arginine N-methyltransferase 7 n=1 Tax=Arion vulgaris TaxID=1028688 RepID=A0A0B6ZTI7_9EUPU
MNSALLFGPVKKVTSTFTKGSKCYNRNIILNVCKMTCMSNAGYLAATESNILFRPASTSTDNFEKFEDDHGNAKGSTKKKSSVTKLSQNQASFSESLTFLSHPNPVTGQMDWVVRHEDYDYLQEIARSGYGDMLHDEDRNKKYYLAIKQAVRFLKEQNKKVKCLDIGTGTSLLSMMAANSGADTITACEAFQPMAACAEKVLAINGFKDKVQLLNKRSTEVTLEDMGERANLLVTELFDTELIGEGAIESYTDAHSRLMEEDCVAVPAMGIMYVQAVQCELLKMWNTLHPIKLPNGTVISVPTSCKNCTGAISLHDLQVDELKDHLQFLSAPVEVFRFDFSRRSALHKQEQNKKVVSALQNGRVDAFVMWWDLIMDPQGEIVLSCGPCWTKEKGETVPWRDHWMQALYYPSSSILVEKGEEFDIHSFHDEYSLCFDTLEIDRLRQSCVCGLHIAFGRNRLGQVNDHNRNQTFIKALEKHITPSTVCLVISDGSLLPLFAAHLGARKVFYLDTNWSSRKVLKELIVHNGLEDRVTVLEKHAEDITDDDLQNLKIDLVIAEPHFQSALLPWEHLYFWYAVSALRQHLSQSYVILPEKMIIKAMAVQFRDLHKIRAPVGNCEGFNISDFDRLIEMASESADEDIEPHPLWEYPAEALSAPAALATIQFSQQVQDIKQIQDSMELLCCREGILNGVVFWSEFYFSDDMKISSGLISDSWDDKIIKWDMFSKQGVKLFRHGKMATGDTKLNISTQFTPENGDFSFKFSIDDNRPVH